MEQTEEEVDNDLSTLIVGRTSTTVVPLIQLIRLHQCLIPSPVGGCQ